MTLAQTRGHGAARHVLSPNEGDESGTCAPQSARHEGLRGPATVCSGRVPSPNDVIDGCRGCGGRVKEALFQAVLVSGGVARLGVVPGKVYAFANQKGGVGKTTTTINLAACLAEAGQRALVVDLDPQANATSGLGMQANGSSSYDLLDGVPLAELARPTRFENLFLVPSKPELAGAAVELSQRDDGDRYLAEALQDAGEFDFVLLDCPPSLGPLTVNALAAADRVVVPVQTEYYALEGLAQLVQSINLIKARLNAGLAIAGVLLTMADGRTRLSAEVESEVRKHFGKLVFDAVVPRSVRVAEAPSHGLPVTHYDRRSPGAEAYWKVAMELVERP